MMKLYATIKKSSKYAYQGRDEKSGKPIVFEIREILEDFYAFRMNGNRYRREDLNFYVKSPGGHFIKLHR